MTQIKDLVVKTGSFYGKENSNDILFPVIPCLTRNLERILATD
ncbi:MAG: hypothetical protein U9N18_03920 [Campylobacterota bacterium]|nr:hypothetical protein [Campylobacterota bacterium]